MKCLRKYKWLKLQRACLPQGRGIMGYWAKLASRAAFRKGIGIYCKHHNAVTPGMWKGGIVGLKKILGIKRRQRVLWIMHELEDLGLIKFTLDERTRKMTYEILDWVPLCSGPDITDGNVYATEGFGFFGVPRNLTERLIDNGREFDEADAWVDLWCHTVYRDYGNAFSFLGAAVQFGKYGSVLTLEGLGKRWHWEKTKVWRFFQKNADTFALIRLPSSYGCIIYNRCYFEEDEVQVPEESDVLQMLDEIREGSRKGIDARSESERINMMIAWNSRKVIKKLEELAENESEENRVASVSSYTRAYFSHGRNLSYSSKCIYDCLGVLIKAVRLFDLNLMGEVRPFLLHACTVDSS